MQTTFGGIGNLFKVTFTLEDLSPEGRASLFQQMLVYYGMLEEITPEMVAVLERCMIKTEESGK